MAKETQSKSNEKKQPAKPAVEVGDVGAESEWEGFSVAVPPGSLADLPPVLKAHKTLEMQKVSGNQAVQRALQVSVIQRQGGGGGNTTPIPKLSSHAERQGLAVDVLKKAYGGRINSETKVNPVNNESALRAEYDRSMMTQGKQIMDEDEEGNEVLRDWRSGDTHNHPDMSGEFHGFRDTSNNQIYIDTSKPPDEQTATIAHEMLHASSSGNFIATLGKGIDEGMTEKLTIDAFTKSGYSVSSGMFAEWVTFANRLCSAFGAGVMVDSYFGGTGALRDAINATLGRGSYLTFTQAVQNGDWATANDMIARGKVATVEAIFNQWWVSDEDIGSIEAIYRESSGDEKDRIRNAIQSNISSLMSIGQRTRLRVLLAGG